MVLPGFGMVWWGPAWFWWVPPYLGRSVPVLLGNGLSRHIITPFRLGFGGALAGSGWFWFVFVWSCLALVCFGGLLPGFGGYLPPMGAQLLSCLEMFGNDWKWPPKAINYAF